MWETLCHAPYSPDLCPPDFNLFLKLKELLRGTGFGSLNDLLLATTREICHLNKEWLSNGIQKLPDYWQVCIERGEDYIEGLEILFCIIVNTF